MDFIIDDDLLVRCHVLESVWEDWFFDLFNDDDFLIPIPDVC